MRSVCSGSLIMVFLLAVLAAASACFASNADDGRLRAAFAGAQVVDLRTCQVSSVVTLREGVKIPPPTQSVLVKTFKRDALPNALKPILGNPGVTGVTISGRYVAIINTGFSDEQRDILRHELVHAYITLASPKPLPFWFQEGSAVYFSTDEGRKLLLRPLVQQQRGDAGGQSCRPYRHV